MRFLLPLLFALVLVFAVPVAPAAAAPVLLFDEAHAQPFRIGQDGPLDLSSLAALYRTNGYDVRSESGALTAETLAAADVLVLSGPFTPLAAAEMQAVLDFIEGGGGLAVMLHVAPPVRQLLHRLDVDFTNGTLRETTGVLGDNPQDFRVINLTDHPITVNLAGFSVYGAWALRGTAAHTRILAATSQHGWVDRDGDRRLTRNDAVQTFGVMVGGELGKGRYVVLGDDALFQNRFLDEDNRQLALALANWLAFR